MGSPELLGKLSLCLVSIPNVTVISPVALLLYELELQTEAKELCESWNTIIARQRGPLGI